MPLDGRPAFIRKRRQMGQERQPGHYGDGSEGNGRRIFTVRN